MNDTAAEYFKRQDKLNELGISANLISDLLKIGKKIPESRWDQLFKDLTGLNQNQRNEAVRLIIEKAPKTEKGIQVNPQLRTLRAKVRSVLSSQKRNECLENRPELQELSHQFDHKEKCNELPVFLCHHCHTPLCASHSYWIPDEKFPFIMKHSVTDQGIHQDQEGIKNAKLMIVIGAILCILLIGIPLLIIGLQMKKKAEANVTITGKFYPQYSFKSTTKWENQIEEKYEHCGYYTAVHCWDCLKTYHAPFYYTAQRLIHIGESKLTRYRKKMVNGTRLYTESELNAMKNMIGNLYFSTFKISTMVGFPFEDTMRVMVRPPMFANQINRPTPLWVFEPRISNKHGFREITHEQWINQILNRIIQYGDTL